jgi:hypothetical protein
VLRAVLIPIVENPALRGRVSPVDPDFAVMDLPVAVGARAHRVVPGVTTSLASRSDPVQVQGAVFLVSAKEAFSGFHLGVGLVDQPFSSHANNGVDALAMFF